MNNIINNITLFQIRYRSFLNSMVISIALIILILFVMIIIENFLFYIEQKFLNSNQTRDISIKILVYFFEFFTLNLIFLFLGTLLFSIISSSFFIFYKIMFILNLLFSLIKLSIKLFYLYQLTL